MFTNLIEIEGVTGHCKPAGQTEQAHAKFLKQASRDNPLNVVIVHGDPNKPNEILPGGKWDEDDFYTVEVAKQALEPLQDRYNFIWLSNHDTLIADLQELKRNDQVDLVLQLCDEGWQNNSRMEMHVITLLEMFGIPYTGASPKCIAQTLDKQAVVKIAESINVPVPRSAYVEDDSQCDPSLYGLQYPVLVKPNSSDGSFGITQKSVCNDLKQVKAAIQMIREEFQLRCPVLIQEFLTGRDVNVGVMEMRNPKTGAMEIKVLPISEEDYSALPDDLPKICGYESKWDSSSPYYKIATRPTTLSVQVQDQMSEWVRKMFKRIDCHDYARFDWRLDGEGNPRLLEVNPNCGWCWDGHLPKTASLAGINYTGFFETIILSALDRAAKQAMMKEQDKNKKFIVVGSNGAEELYKK